VLDTLESPTWLVHVAYLAAMFAAGVLAAVRGFTRKLEA
jgi:hypothetical protein